MTELGVRPLKSVPYNRLLPVSMPSYQYDHPSINTVKLATVKEGMFNPALPRHRRLDIDSSTGKMTDEHSRFITKCTREDFQEAKSSVFNRTPQYLYSMGITETGRKIFKHFNANDELRGARLSWSEFLNRCPERYKIRLPEAVENCCGSLEFSGYAVRYLRPSITQAWKRPLSRYIPSSAATGCEVCMTKRSQLPY